MYFVDLTKHEGSRLMRQKKKKTSRYYVAFDFFGLSVKLSIQGLKSSEKFWLGMTNSP